MISCLIFTKDRACQLELLLRSINENFQEISKIFIIVKSSLKEYQDGYDKLQQEHITNDKITWINETGLKEDMLYCLSKMDTKYSLILVDDEVVIRNFSILPAIQTLEEKFNILHTISLRLHPKITYTYTSNVETPTPNFNEINGLYCWDWTKENPINDFGYPAAINSQIWQTSFLSYWVAQLQYGNVNDFEGQLNTKRSIFRPGMGCFVEAKTVNISNNLVQSGMNRFSHIEKYSQKNLNHKYMEGYRISTKNLYDLNFHCATFPYEYLFEKV